MILGLTVFVGVVGIHALAPSELERVEAQLEQTAGAKLKDTWPAFRDSLCKGMTGDELNDCRLYQTRLFEQQIRIYNEGRKEAASGA